MSQRREQARAGASSDPPYLIQRPGRVLDVNHLDGYATRGQGPSGVQSAVRDASPGKDLTLDLPGDLRRRSSHRPPEQRARW
jgi:hypothetical protein